MIVLGGFLLAASAFLLFVYRDQVADSGWGGKNARRQTQVAKVALLIGAVIFVIGLLVALLS